MKRALLRTFIVLFFCLLSCPVFAGSWDAGGTLFNSTGIGFYPSLADFPTSPDLVQKSTANLWLEAVFGDQLSFAMQVEATYTNQPELFFVDADLLYLRGSFTSPQPGLSQYRYTLGRAVLTDFSGLVLSQKADGVMLEFAYPNASLAFSAAYTGLVSKGASTMTMSKADVSDVSNASVLFAPPRLVAMVQLNVLDLFGQRLNVELIAQQDMRGTVLDVADLALAGQTVLVTSGEATYSPLLGGQVNTQYLGLGLDGAITSSVYYDLCAYAEAGEDLVYDTSLGSYQPSTFIAALAKAGVRWYIDKLFSVLGATFIYVSGDSGSSTVVEGNTQLFSYFAPVSQTTLSYVFSPQLSNVMVAEASYSLKPLSWTGSELWSKLAAEIKADVYFRPTAGAISESGVAAGDTNLYLGTETDLTLNFRPLSDVGVTLWGGLFFPGAAFGTDAALRYECGLDVSLSL